LPTVLQSCEENKSVVLHCTTSQCCT